MKNQLIGLVTILVMIVNLKAQETKIEDSIWDQIQPKRVAHYDAKSLDLSFGKRVITWPDISGNENHAFQPDPFYRPTYVNGSRGPVLRFDHQGYRVFFYEDKETKEKLKEYPHPVSMIIMFKFNRGGNHSIIDGASHLNRNRLVFDGGMGNRLFMTNYPDGPWLGNQAGFTFTKGQEDLNIAVCIFKGSHSILRINNGEQQAVGNVGNKPLTGFNLGGHAAIDGGHHEWALAADIAEIIFFDGELTSDEIVMIEQHLSGKWGLEVKYVINLLAEPSSGGTVKGKGSFSAGSIAKLTATPAEGYVFIHWIDQDDEIIGTESPFEFTVPEKNTTITAVFDLSGSSKNISPDQIKLFPNPAKDLVTVISPDLIHQIMVADMSGKIVFQCSVSNTETHINTSSWSTGIYTIQVYTDKGLISQQVSVQR